MSSTTRQTLSSCHPIAWLFALTTVALFVFTIAACGEDGCESDDDCAGDRECELGQCVDVNGDTNGNGGDTNGNGGDTNGDDEYWCCINGDYYACPDEDAVDQCVFEFDTGSCERDSSGDSECDDNGNGGNGNDGNGGNGGGQEIGELCQEDHECEDDICVWENPGDTYGYCTKFCESFADCPSFWSCEELADAPADVCVED